MRIIRALTRIAAAISIAALATDTRADQAGTLDITSAALPAQSTGYDGTIMGIFDKTGFGQLLERSGIKVYGYAQGGYMYDSTAPQPYAGPTFLGLNNLRNTPLLDKISLNAERTVDPAKMEFDLGFRLEGIWGYDARFIHSNGLGDTQTGRYQLDPLQAYIDVALPCLPAKMRAGKWIELAGFEHFSANIYGAFGDPARALYSYSYQFLYAEPGTQTGVLGTYLADPTLSFDIGFTRGWNQSTRDSNCPFLDLLGRVTYAPSDKTSFVFVMTEGPEFPIGVGRNLPAGDKGHWWTALDLVVTHKVTGRMSLGAGVDLVMTPGLPEATGYPEGAKAWGGVAGYISYAANRFATINARAEWFNDSSDGYCTAASTGANYVEGTLGVALRPFPDDKALSRLLIRPEIRYDGSNQRVFATGDSRPGEKGQLTFSGDILYTF